MNILFEQFVFILSIIGLFFLPGSLLLLAFFRNRPEKFFSFEFLIFSFALGLTFINFEMLILDRLGIPLSRISLIGLAFLTILVPFLFLKFRNHREQKKQSWSLLNHGINIGFSRKESVVFIGLLVLTVFIKTIFLWNTILPTSTDLGHHMFWAKKIAIERSIPLYEEIEIDFKSGENTLTDPQPIDDFIIGEHLPFAALSLVSSADVRSAFPSIFLFLINILGILALLFLGFHLFREVFDTPHAARRALLVAFLLIGPLWALSSPEAKYVSGGVVGNIFGNFLIPVIFLTLFRAFREKSAPFLLLAILFFGTLAYTHHLSTLIFLFTFLFIIAAFIILGQKHALRDIVSFLKLFLTPLPIFGILFLGAMLLFVYAPTYLDITSVDTALGSPSKGTREGLSWGELAESIGGARLGLELSGIFLLLLSPFRKTRKTLGAAVLLGWSLGLITMTLFPATLFLDIPSNRVVTYATFPAALLGAVAFSFLFFKKNGSSVQTSAPSVTEHSLLRWSFSLLLIATIVGGFFDNGATHSRDTNAKEAVQTFIVSEWLARHTLPNEWILKDHNYIVADSWMKLFFLRDYSYPLSRGYFRRYTDEVTPREQCTLLMISAPNTPKGQACFESTGVDTIVVNPRYDAAQFNKAKDMSLMYVSDSVAVYKKINC